MRRWWLAWLLLAALAACDDEEPILPGPACPNAVPEDGEPCPVVGLTCNYFTTCEQYFLATCTASGVWSFDDACPTFPGTGGAGGMGGMASTSSSTTVSSSSATTTTSTGGEAGAGGMGGHGGAGGGGGL